MFRPTATAVTPLDDFCLRVVFDNGETKILVSNGAARWLTRLTSAASARTATPSNGQIGRIFARMNCIIIARLSRKN